MSPMNVMSRIHSSAGSPNGWVPCSGNAAVSTSPDGSEPAPTITWLPPRYVTQRRSYRRRHNAVSRRAVTAVPLALPQHEPVVRDEVSAERLRRQVGARRVNTGVGGGQTRQPGTCERPPIHRRKPHSLAHHAGVAAREARGWGPAARVGCTAWRS
jgi:hypothetical protein